MNMKYEWRDSERMMSDNQKSWIKIQCDEFGDGHVRDEIFSKGQNEWFQNRQMWE